MSEKARLLQRLVRRELVWHPGPANGGGGTAQEEFPGRDGSYWWDGEIILIIVENHLERLILSVHVNADGDSVCLQDPDTTEMIGYGIEDVSWWAKLDGAVPPLPNPPREPRAEEVTHG